MMLKRNIIICLFFLPLHVTVMVTMYPRVVDFFSVHRYLTSAKIRSEILNFYEMCLKEKYEQKL